MADAEQLCQGCLRTYTVTGGDFDPDWTLHPGTTWREVIEHKGVTQTEAAPQIGISLSLLNNIVCGHRLPTPEVTVQFARWAGVEARFMWQLVANYKLDLALGKTPISLGSGDD